MPRLVAVENWREKVMEIFRKYTRHVFVIDRAQKYRGKRP